MICYQCSLVSATSEAKDDLLKKEIKVGRLNRTYLLHVPPTYKKDKPTPMVLAFHGGSGQGKNMVQVTSGGWNILADKEQFIVVYPDAIEKNWNDGRNVERFRSQRENIDDVGFISALIDGLGKEFNIDKRRIYATGISNGGIFSYRLACALTDKIAAIAPVIGSMAEGYSSQCSPSRPISVLAINSVQDPLLPYKGGEVKSMGVRLGRVASVADAISFWVARNGCSAKPAVEKLPVLVDDDTKIQKETYGKCKDDTEVILYSIEGAGHTWPSGYQYLPALWVGKTSKNLDANVVIWEFFKRHSL
jgi:polyhydroxybutyrate depolymerase